MRRAVGLVLAALVLVPASAGAGTTRPPLGLTATPARIALVGSGRASVLVANPGKSTVVVDATRAGFSLDLRGRPRVVRRSSNRSAGSWLTVRPGRLVLPPGASRRLTVSSLLPSRAEPGDHDALVLLTTRPRAAAGVALRMRIGVVVVVRAPGPVIHALSLRGLRVRRVHRTRVLELTVANRGNVTETIDAGRIGIAVRQRDAEERVRPDSRAIRPRSSGIVQFRYRGRLVGWVTVRVRLVQGPGRPAVSRIIRVKL